MFLTGGKLSDRIVEVVKGDDARIAVAFWGNEAQKKLGITHRTDLRIICDISMGGTNPAELAKLGAPSIKNLRYRDNFHAKIYLSDDGSGWRVPDDCAVM